jgi:hypothetical protein
MNPAVKYRSYSVSLQDLRIIRVLVMVLSFNNSSLSSMAAVTRESGSLII